MPSSTFHNISEDKKERIIELALEEFASKPYELASLTSIISAAGIAKGSIYQYFENKKDLYLYLLDECLENRTRFMENEIGGKEKNLFKWYARFLLAKVNFDLQYPVQSAFLANALVEEWSEELGNLKVDFQLKAQAYFKEQIAKMAKKKVAKKDVELLAYSMASLARGLTDHLIMRMKKDNAALAARQEPVNLLDHHKFIKKSCQQLAKSLKSGFALIE